MPKYVILKRLSKPVRIAPNSRKDLSFLFAISISFQQLNLARLPLEYDLKGQDKSSSFRCMFGNTFLAFSILTAITMKLVSDLMYVICNIYYVSQYSSGLEWERMGLSWTVVMQYSYLLLGQLNIFLLF